MKNQLLLLLVFTLAFVSCKDGKDEKIAQLENKLDSLTNEMEKKKAQTDDESAADTSTKEESPSSSTGYKKCPDNNHPHAIDLGLPSGTKWACCNVGASIPTGNGDYYAWGEIEEKSEYSEDTYLYHYTLLDSDVAGTQYDVAHVKLGGSWVMPTFEQIQELRTKCSYENTTLNGVAGGRFTGPNGCSIFFPLAGLRLGDDFMWVGEGAYYWTSIQDQTNCWGAYCLELEKDEDLDESRWNYWECEEGLSVRPVCK